MTDLHMHLEHYEYTVGSVEEFLANAKKRGLQTIGFSDHSYHFKEFKEMYFRHARMDDSPIGRFQDNWLNKGKKSFIYDLDQYAELISKGKSLGLPIKLGIEVCYFPGEEEFLKGLLSRYPFDYIIGSVHWLDGWAFDMRAEDWKNLDPDPIFERYTEIFVQSISSELFDIVAHPYSCLVFGAQTVNFEQEKAYKAIAEKALRHNVALELNSGLAYRYPYERITPPLGLLTAGAAIGCPFSVGSDAHKAEDCGRGIAYLNRLAKDAGLKSLASFTQREYEPQTLRGGNLI